jgi:hypothetical protein
MILLDLPLNLRFVSSVAPGATLFFHEQDSSHAQ